MINSLLQRFRNRGVPEANKAVSYATFVIARMTLENYYRSAWLWGEFAATLVLYAVLFLPIRVTNAHLFAEAGLGLYTLALLGAVVLVRSSIGGRNYLTLAKLSSRKAFARGLILATALLRIPLFLLLLAIILANQNIDKPDFGHIIIGSIGLIANCLVISALTVALSPPFSTRLTRIIFIAWLGAVFSPVKEFSMLFDLLRLPFLPFAFCFNMGLTGIFEWFDLVALVVEAGYLIGLIYLAGRWLERRELLFSS